MPNVLCSHYQNRKNVCAACGKKIVVCGSKSLSAYLITEIQAGLIKTFLCQEFDSNNDNYPLSICVTCRLTLYDHEDGKTSRRLPSMRNYGDLILLKEIRNQSKNCNCYICLTGRATVHKNIKKSRGLKRKFEDKIVVGINAASDVTSLPEANNQNHLLMEKRAKVHKLCNNCSQKIGKGIPHKCGSSTKTMNNILATVLEKLPETQQDQLTAKLINLNLKKVNSEQENPKTSSLKLQTMGRSMTIDVNPKRKEIFFTEEQLDNY